MVAAPLPILVLQAISVGFDCLVAQARAFWICLWSWPSMALTAQPEALKRASWSVLSDSDTLPSMVISLSSHMTQSLFSFRRPARAMASCDTPSIRQPSPAMTQVR
ncbi:hypothetical protein D3C81_1868470 [compost metagenome]